MRLGEAIDAIEAAESLVALKIILQKITEDYGFGSFGFLDVGSPGLDNPFFIATSHIQWIEDYKSNDFVDADPMLPIVRRTNTPFVWSDIQLPRRRGKWKSMAEKIMDAARDFGMNDGLVIPFHFADKLGRLNSACCTFHWKEKAATFHRMPKHYKTDLHLIMIYWSQRVMELAASELGRRPRIGLNADEIANIRLTDRERSILEWAARGKTMAETAAILFISNETVQTHLSHAFQKLQTVNKTQAVVRAIKLGLIDV